MGARVRKRGDSLGTLPPGEGSFSHHVQDRRPSYKQKIFPTSKQRLQGRLRMPAGVCRGAEAHVCGWFLAGPRPDKVLGKSAQDRRPPQMRRKFPYQNFGKAVAPKSGWRIVHTGNGKICGRRGSPPEKTGTPSDEANRLGSRQSGDARTYARAAAGKDSETAATLAGWRSRHPIPEGRSKPQEPPERLQKVCLTPCWEAAAGTRSGLRGRRDLRRRSGYFH